MKDLSSLCQEKEIIPCFVCHGTYRSARQLDHETFLYDRAPEGRERLCLTDLYPQKVAHCQCIVDTQQTLSGEMNMCYYNKPLQSKGKA